MSGRMRLHPSLPSSFRSLFPSTHFLHLHHFAMSSQLISQDIDAGIYKVQQEDGRPRARTSHCVV